MLLELNFSTCFLELAFDLLSLLLGNTLLNGLGSTVNKCLSIAQRKTCDVLHYLDNLELGLTCSLQDNVERRLLGGSSLACACSGGCNGNSGSSRLNAILLLEDLCEFVYLGNLQVYQLFSKFLYVCHSCKLINLFLILVCEISCFSIRASSRGPQSFGLH